MPPPFVHPRKLILLLVLFSTGPLWWWWFTSCSVSGLFGELSVCPKVMALSGCALFPPLSRLLCGTTCGFCVDGRERAVPSPLRWGAIDRVAWGSITYEQFEERYKRPGVPVVITGFADAHPAMRRWGFGRLADVCGARPVGFVQRRAVVLADLQRALAEDGSGVLAWLFDAFLSARFGATVGELIARANEVVSVSQLVDRIRGEAVAGNDFRSALEYLASSYSVNDFDVAELCPELLADLVSGAGGKASGRAVNVLCCAVLGGKQLDLLLTCHALAVAGDSRLGRAEHALVRATLLGGPKTATLGSFRRLWCLLWRLLWRLFCDASLWRWVWRGVGAAWVPRGAPLGRTPSATLTAAVGAAVWCSVRLAGCPVGRRCFWRRTVRGRTRRTSTPTTSATGFRCPEGMVSRGAPSRATKPPVVARRSARVPSWCYCVPSRQLTFAASVSVAS